jgi:Anti-sigma-28 factor, FlgM
MSPNKVSEIKQLVARGEYRIEPHQIADAMIRWAEFELDPTVRRSRRERPQNECSKPDSSSSASVKMAAGGPSTTEPIHVRAASALVQAA